MISLIFQLFGCGAQHKQPSNIISRNVHYVSYYIVNQFAWQRRAKQGINRLRQIKQLSQPENFNLVSFKALEDLREGSTPASL